jgi:hypothetical protein
VRQRLPAGECDRTIAEREALLGDQPDGPERQLILDDIDHERQIRAVIARVIPD